MTILKSKRNFKKDLEKVRKVSSIVEKKIGKSDQKYKNKIDQLSDAELHDLNEILRLADLVLTKHEVKKEFHSILKEFVEIIARSADSVETLDDEISELIISAEGTLDRIKSLQGKVSDQYDFEQKGTSSQTVPSATKNSSNNLTKSSTGVYTQGYQHTSAVETEQVI